METMPRSLKLFEMSIKSPKTLLMYKNYLGKFLAWAHKDHESLLLLPSDQLQILLEDYLLHLRKTLSYSAINTAISAVAKFLEVNDREFKKQKLRMLMPEKKKPTGKQAFSTKQIQKMLEFADTLRNKALIHCLSAGGFRSGAFEELKWKHISEMPDSCYAVTVYAGSNHEYVTFLHYEARTALDDYTDERRQNGEHITKESYVFVDYKRIAVEKDKPMTSQAVGNVLMRIMKKSKIERVLAEGGKRFEISRSNGFRKRYNTILKTNPNISYAISERMMDHATYMEPHYLDTSDKQRFFEEYKKAIPELIISDEERLKIQGKLKDDAIQKIESEKDRRITALETKLDNVEKLLGRIKDNKTPNEFTGNQ